MLNDNGDRKPGRNKVQRTLTSMFNQGGPKFVEVNGVQLVCPYCNHKFRAPQGLVNHKYIHERAGHTLYPRKKILFKFNNASSEKKSDQQNPVDSSEQGSLPEKREEQPEDEKNCRSIAAESDKENNTLVSEEARENNLMCRRFTIAEKLEILDEYKKSENISATCR